MSRLPFPAAGTRGGPDSFRALMDRAPVACTCSFTDCAMPTALWSMVEIVAFTLPMNCAT